MKRIIWALGFLFLWTLNDFLLVYSNDIAVDNMVYQIGMFLIWIIPLFRFKDDKTTQSKSTTKKRGNTHQRSGKIMNNCKHCGFPLSAHSGGRIGFSGCEEFEEIEDIEQDGGEK